MAKDNLIIIVNIILFSSFIGLSTIHYLTEGINKLVILVDIIGKIIVLIILAFGVKLAIAADFPQCVFILIVSIVAMLAVGLIYYLIIEKLPL